MAGYIGPIPVPQATQSRETFTATASQTSFGTAGYQVGYLDVFMNGVKLAPADFTATNGSDVVLASGAAVNDIIEVVSYSAFEVLNQNFTGTTVVDNLTVGGNLTVDGTTTTINSTTLNVDDINITVASGAADSAAANGAGLTVDGAGATFNYSHSGTKWTMNKPLDVGGNLDVTGTLSSDGLNVEVPDNNSGPVTIQQGGNSYFKIVTTNASESVQLGNSTTNPDVLLGGGHVGIGTSTPSAPLSTVANSSAQAIHVLGRSSDDIGQIAFWENDGTTATALLDARPTAFNIRTYSTMNFTRADGSTSVAIDSSGNVGIGESSPLSNLHIEDTSGAVLTLGNSQSPNDVVTGTVFGRMNFYASDRSGTNATGGVARIEAIASAGYSNSTPSDLLFYTHGTSANDGSALGNPTERMRISSAGDLELIQSNNLYWKHAGGGTIRAGITADSSDNLIFSTGSSDTTRMTLDGSNGNVGIGTPNPTSNYGTNLNVHSSATNGAALHLTDGTTGNTSNDGFHLISTGGLAYVWNREATDMVFGTSNTERMRVLAGGGVTFNGDTAQANALDDYEEGTWTPTADAGITGFSLVSATYTKVGRMVTVMFYVQSPNGNSGSNLQIGGLPYTPASNNYSTGWVECNTNGHMGMIRTNSSNTHLTFFYPDPSTAQRVSLTGNDVGSSHILGSITYQTS